jgi:hypothetical protein
MCLRLSTDTRAQQRSTTVDRRGMASRILRLRRDDRCVACAAELTAGTRAFWDAERRTVTCTPCLTAASGPAEIDRGQPGASAAREHARRKRNREQRAGPLDELGPGPQHETAFLRGSLGEEAVAKTLEARTAGRPVVLLHDRRTPSGRGNIDHLAIARTGVFVIDAKDWIGKVEITPARPGPRMLLINRFDQARLVDGLDDQVAAVRTLLATTSQETPIHGVFCFTRAELPPNGTLTMRSHLFLYRRALADRLNTGGPLTRAEIDTLAHLLATAFPPA